MRLAPSPARLCRLVLCGIGPGVVTVAWLRAAGRAGCGRRAFPGGSPGALLVLPVAIIGPRAGCRTRLLVYDPDDHEQSRACNLRSSHW
jgi:hypothetical protein